MASPQLCLEREVIAEPLVELATSEARTVGVILSLRDRREGEGADQQ